MHDEKKQEEGGSGTKIHIESKSVLKNKDLNDKTLQVQQEFENLMNEMVKRRSGGMGVATSSLPEVDDLLDGYYLPVGKERKHKSPTKRLINLKNSTTVHKQRILENVQRGDYSQTYCIAPGQSYVIEPQGGELPYEIAEKKPEEFFKQVLN